MIMILFQGDSYEDTGEGMIRMWIGLPSGHPNPGLPVPSHSDGVGLRQRGEHLSLFDLSREARTGVFSATVSLHYAAQSTLMSYITYRSVVSRSLSLSLKPFWRKRILHALCR